jgi:hypothetical protein
MKIRTLAFLALLLAGFQLFSLPAGAAELRYEPAVVELTGIVVLEEHFGPPCFGDSPMTDQRELIAVLVPDKPVSVQGDPPGAGLNETSYSNVRRIQLV